MVAATVLIPTHNHAETLPHAVASVQEQTLSDFELFIVGDGVNDQTRECTSELIKGDSRIRFFDFPKGPRKGEIHRHTALNEATGRFVAYLGDDDFWLPCHLAILNELLSEADFGHTLHIGLDEQGKLFALAADLECQDFRRRMLTERFNRFDFIFGGHTLEAYRRIPTGWHTVPLGEFPWGDLYIWRQFLAEPWCRVRSLMIPTAICTQTHRRPYLSNRERADELSHWRGESIKPHFREMLWREVASTFARDLIRHEIGVQSLQSEIAEQSKIRQELERRISELESNWAETTRSLCDLSLKLSVVRKSRLLKAGRLLRRLTGRPIPY